MLLSELFIIYLAAAAPFGVSRFLALRARGAHARRALLKAAGAALSWPYASVKSLLRRAASRRGEAREADESGAVDSGAVERSARAAANALRSIEDLLEGDEARRALYAARECVERYTGLALACASADAEAGPSAREMELCRIAGRAGDDLLVAGRCVHRRNVTRLLAHRERARAELLRALEGVCEVAQGIYAPPQSFRFTERPRAADARHARTLVADALARVVELLSLFDDGATLERVTRMLGEERARAVCPASSAGAESGAAAPEGEESCTTQVAPTAFATRPLPTTTSQGG